MLGLSAQLVLVSGYDVPGDNNERESDSNVPVFYLSVISKGLKWEIWNESVQSFSEISITTLPQSLKPTANNLFKSW